MPGKETTRIFWGHFFLETTWRGTKYLQRHRNSLAKFYFYARLKNLKGTFGGPKELNSKKKEPLKIVMKDDFQELRVKIEILQRLGARQRGLNKRGCCMPVQDGLFLFLHIRALLCFFSTILYVVSCQNGLHIRAENVQFVLQHPFDYIPFWRHQ